jgi:hypothetical protein
VRYPLRPFALWWRYLPQLVALYLLGWLDRKGAIELAAFVGWDNDIRASLIMPFDAHIFGEMGHDSMLEPGWQAVAERIIGWIGHRGL